MKFAIFIDNFKTFKSAILHFVITISCLNVYSIWFKWKFCDKLKLSFQEDVSHRRDNYFYHNQKLHVNTHFARLVGLDIIKVAKNHVYSATLEKVDFTLKGKKVKVFYLPSHLDTHFTIISNSFGGSKDEQFKAILA